MDKDRLAEWEAAPPVNDFVDRFGPLLRRRIDNRWAYGLRVEEWHRNEAGILHGGAMSALIDEVAGTFVNETTGRRHVTVQISTTFLQPVRVGELVEPECDIVKVTRSMSFVDVKLRVDEAVVATASLIFKASRSSPS